MPTKIDITRKPVIKSDSLVVMTSTALEEMTPDEFMNVYNRKAGELEQDKGTLEQGKMQLKETEDIKETEELKAFAEKMRLCERIKNKTALQVELRDIEVRVAAKEKELKDMSAVFVDLQTRKKAMIHGQKKLGEK